MWKRRSSNHYHGRNYSKHTNRMQYMQQQRQDVMRLQLNDPSLTTMRCGIPNNFDIEDFFVVLGQALETNTRLRHLTLLNLSLKLADAQALAKGIGGSKLEFLSLSHAIGAITQYELEEMKTFVSLEDTDVEKSARFWEHVWESLQSIQQSLWEGLQSSQTLQELFIGILPTGGLVKLGEALPLMQSLRKLGFQELSLTKESAHALANGIGQAKLECLELKGCIKEKKTTPLDTEQPTKSGCIRQIFYQGIASSKTISDMVLVDFPMEELENLKEGLQLLKTLKVEGPQYGENILHSLFVHENFFDRVFECCVTALAQALHGSGCLTSLVLQKCQIDAKNVSILFAHGLNSILSLTELKLHECGIGDDAIGVLVENWHPDSSIQRLSLQDNIIKPSGVQTLLRAARNHPNLRMLDVSNNSGIGYAGLKIIGDELPNQEYLTHLELSNCISCGGVYQQRLQHPGPALLAGIKRNSHIRHLNVGSNSLSFENDIQFYASANMGRHLMAADPQVVALSVWSYILAKSARQEVVRLGASVIFFYLLEQPTLVQRISSIGETNVE